MRARLLLGLITLAACSTESRRAERSELSGQPQPSSEAPAALGRSVHESLSGGTSRRWLLYLPSAAAPGNAGLPLVFNLHGSGGTPEDQLELSGLELLAEREGIVIVAPEGVGRMWNVPVDPSKPDDVRFMSELIDQVSSLTSIDRQRVYATGFSGGGRMVSQLACDLSERIAAIAAIGGIRFPGPCAQARAMPILAFHGTADETNPYAGGGQPYWGTGVESAVEGWASHNGCGPRRETHVAPLVDELAYAGERCADVVLYRIQGFEHAWPGVIYPDREGGTANETGAAVGSADTTANQSLWSFFQLHPLPPAR